MSCLLVVGKEVEYADRVLDCVYRGRPFWVSSDGCKALAIPTQVRPMSDCRAWTPYDHTDPRRISSLFNFGPVSGEQIAELILPEAPPFFYHTLSGRARTRVKFGDGHAYGEGGSYYWGWYEKNHRTLRLDARYTMFLPEPFKTQWERARPFCVSLAV